MLSHSVEQAPWEQRTQRTQWTQRSQQSQQPQWAQQPQAQRTQWGQPTAAIEETAYGFRVATTMPFEAAVEKVTAALKPQGFGVLTTIDVKATLQQKMGVAWRDYVILGACNPPLAHRALQAEPELGLLLPCNVIVYALDDGRCTVSVIDPQKIMDVVGNAGLSHIASEAAQRLRMALTMLLVA